LYQDSRVAELVDASQILGAVLGLQERKYLSKWFDSTYNIGSNPVLTTKHNVGFPSGNGMNLSK
jgi:hypothetical protein